MRKSTIAAAVAGAAMLLLITSAPAMAVIDGTTDTTSRFPNVGGLQVRSGGEWFDFCSGTLVAPDVVLTAAHCTDFFAGAGGPPGGGNSKMSFLKDGLEDMALVFLTKDVANVTPAPVADAGYLDGLDLTSETFTVAGYGTDKFITGSAASPKAITVYDGVRSYKDVSVITEHDLFPDRFVKITKSVCFGDSGGALFHEGTLVALNSWTFSLRCAGPNLEYRIDSAPAQSFLDANL